MIHVCRMFFFYFQTPLNTFVSFFSLPMNNFEFAFVLLTVGVVCFVCIVKLAFLRHETRVNQFQAALFIRFQQH